MTESKWPIFQGNTEPHDRIQELPEPPSWRPFGEEGVPEGSRLKRRGETFRVRKNEIDTINAALFLRRPLLVTGKPGTGKSSLAYAVARELKLGEVLYWPITTRTTLKDGLYNYDAIARLQEAKQQEGQYQRKLSAQERVEQIKQVEKYITLGPLGTALLPSDEYPRPRILLIDEIDKSDIDLPNNLLAILEEGSFEIPELVRIKETISKVTVRTAYSDTTDEVTRSQLTADIEDGRISCSAFPFVVMTSNGERDFPAPFLRRCLRLTMKPPSQEELTDIVAAHLGAEIAEQSDTLIQAFLEKREEGTLATDQLLNAIFLVSQDYISDKDKLIENLLTDLGRNENLESEDLE
ncbi:AAA family ATPase [Roseofilum casamattae]|uniref:MoxR family ATPase n=1 Tax=Roseofilum casamattae BLCC-M143 TaxID=3022442 RepID=A0ABT7BZL5_9CYAN|nr:MoxR family ATPase [Roseofilum casamattae]MDJ1184649.1 MoxR family ATPase [Roseofilum casamattae BLCC-M143]